MSITVNLAPASRSGNCSLPLAALATETLAFAGAELADGAQVTVMLPDGTPVAIGSVVAGSAQMDLNTKESHRATVALPVGQTTKVFLVIGDTDTLRFVVPALLQRNYLDDVIPPTASVPVYPTKAELDAILAEIERIQGVTADQLTGAGRLNAEMQETVQQFNTVVGEAEEMLEQTASSGVRRVQAAGADAVTAIDERKGQAIGDINTAKAGAVNDVNAAKAGAVKAVGSAQTTALGAVQNAQTAAVNAVDTAKAGALSAVDQKVAQTESHLNAKVTEAAGSAAAAETAKATAVSAQTAAEAARTGAENAQHAAEKAQTAAEAAQAAAETAASDAEAVAEEINQQAASIGLLLVKPGCPINIEERNGAICQVRCMGENRFLPACDGVYYSVTSSTKTYFLDKNLNIIKVFNKTFGYYSYHNYNYCGSGTLIIRDGLIWFSALTSVYVADWETGNVLASIAGYASVVHNGLSGNIVAVSSNGLTAARLTYDSDTGAIVAGESFETGLPFSESETKRVHPYHMGSFTIVGLMRSYGYFVGRKVYAMDKSDAFVAIETDADGDLIAFNSTATAAGFEGDKYTNQYASANPGFYWTGRTFADSEGTSHQAFTMTNGLRIWVTSGTTENGVPTFSKFNYSYGGNQGKVFGYPWQSTTPRVPVAISCGYRDVGVGSGNGYFYGCVLSGRNPIDNNYKPYAIKPTIPFAQTSIGGIHSGASLQETKSSNIVAIYPVAPLQGVFSFGGHWGYNEITPGMLIDLRQPLV